MRYIVFGVKNDVLVENETNLYGKALFWADKHTSHDFKARVWDRVSRKFIA